MGEREKSSFLAVFRVLLSRGGGGVRGFSFSEFGGAPSSWPLGHAGPALKLAPAPP